MAASSSGIAARRRRGRTGHREFERDAVEGERIGIGIGGSDTVRMRVIVHCAQRVEVRGEFGIGVASSGCATPIGGGACHERTGQRYDEGDDRAGARGMVHVGSHEAVR